MSEDLAFMMFGAAIAASGLWLAATSRSGSGQTTIRMFGGEVTLAAAGGVIVVILGVVAFSIPRITKLVRPAPKVELPVARVPVLSIKPDDIFITVGTSWVGGPLQISDCLDRLSKEADAENIPLIPSRNLRAIVLIKGQAKVLIQCTKPESKRWQSIDEATSSLDRDAATTSGKWSEEFVGRTFGAAGN